MDKSLGFILFQIVGLGLLWFLLVVVIPVIGLKIFLWFVNLVARWVVPR